MPITSDSGQRNDLPATWHIGSVAPDAPALANSVGCSQLAAAIMLQRGISEPAAASAFLSPAFSQLSGTGSLPDIDLATERIAQAISRGERICIHGDYDSDGVTSTALWSRLLHRLNADVHAYVPHRRRDGYDLRAAFVESARERGAKLIITTDCGIQRVDEVEQATKAGIDVIITDHHEPGDTIPEAVAVVNPRRHDSVYPFPALAGVGVAFRVGEALVERMGHSVDLYRRKFVDLAAIGTITDIMPLISENRVIVAEGLKVLPTTGKRGLRALMRAAGIREGDPMVARSVSHMLGPRLNAIGRLDDSQIALDLLTTNDDDLAESLAGRIEQANKDRREEERRIFEEADSQARERDFHATGCLVLAGMGWHSGVIGIVANRMVERYNRPTVMIAIDGPRGVGRGSARSMGAFDMRGALCECDDLLIEFGGHAHAAGLDIEPTNIQAFTERINDVARERLTPADLEPRIMVDLDVEARALSMESVGDLERLAPWGLANPEPLFAVQNLTVTQVGTCGRERNHLRVRLRAGDGGELDCRWWGGGHMADRVRQGTRWHVCGNVRLDTWRDTTSVLVTIKDMQPAGA